MTPCMQLSHIVYNVVCMYCQCVLEGRGRGGGRIQRVHYSVTHLMRIRWTANTCTFYECETICHKSRFKLLTFVRTYIICISHQKVQCEKMHTTLPTPPPALPTLLEGPWPHCLALWRQSQQLKLHHTSGHHHGPHVHLSFQEGSSSSSPSPRVGDTVSG